MKNGSAKIQDAEIAKYNKSKITISVRNDSLALITLH